MLQKGRIGGWITGTLVAAAVAAAVLTSFTHHGVQVEAGGLEVTFKTSFQEGVTVVFATL